MGQGVLDVGQDLWGRERWHPSARGTRTRWAQQPGWSAVGLRGACPTPQPHTPQPPAPHPSPTDDVRGGADLLGQLAAFHGAEVEVPVEQLPVQHVAHRVLQDPPVHVQQPAGGRGTAGTGNRGGTRTPRGPPGDSPRCWGKSRHGGDGVSQGAAPWELGTRCGAGDNARSQG